MQIYHVPGNQDPKTVVPFQHRVSFIFFLSSFLSFSFSFGYRVSLYVTLAILELNFWRPVWPRTHRDALVSASQLELKTCTTMPSTLRFSWQVCQMQR